MNKILKCRRSIVCLVAIGCLTYLGYSKGLDVSLAIATVAGALCGANAYESKV